MVMLAGFILIVKVLIIRYSWILPLSLIVAASTVKICEGGNNNE